MQVSVLTLLLCAILAAHHQCAAVAITKDSSDSQTYIDDEDSSDGSGSAQHSEHNVAWVQHFRQGDVIFAKSHDIEELVKYITANSANGDGRADFSSQMPSVTEDGPVHTIEDESGSNEESREKRESYVPLDCTEKIVSTNYYPEYAIGELDNGCTAFLIGPYHAMTSADCVYKRNGRLWADKLDFWRGRNESQFLQRMKWETVIIPKSYLETGDEPHDWAIITFEKSHPSPVWLAFGYSQVSTTPNQYMYVTSYGYLDNRNDEMFSKVCEVDIEESDKLLGIACCYNQRTVFHGGPILKGYEFDRSKMPQVIGLSILHRMDYGTFTIDTAVAFSSDMFWSSCFFLAKGGFDPKCAKN